MKFKINKEHFVTGLRQVINVVGTNTQFPELKNVLIKAEDGVVTLTTTNLALAIRCAIKAAVEYSAGQEARPNYNGRAEPGDNG